MFAKFVSFSKTISIFFAFGRTAQFVAINLLARRGVEGHKCFGYNSVALSKNHLHTQ